MRAWRGEAVLVLPGLLIIGALLLLPLIWLFGLSFVHDDRLSLVHYHRLFDDPSYIKSFAVTFQVAGAVATWWGEVVFDLKALMAGGFAGVVESWVTTIVTALEEGGGKGAPLEHKLVQWLLPQFLDEIAEAEGRVAELDGTIKAATGSGEDEEGEGEAAEEDGLSEAEIKALKKDLSAAKKRLKSLIHSFELRLEEAQAELSPEKTEALVRAILRDELQRELERRVAAHLSRWWRWWRAGGRNTG